MVLLNENIVGIDSAIFMHPTIWKASGPVEPHAKPIHEGCLPEASPGAWGRPAGAQAHFSAPWAASRPQAHGASGKGLSPRPCGLECPGAPHFISDALNILQSCHLTGRCGQGRRAWPEHPERGMWGALVLPADVRLTPAEFGSLQKMDGPMEQCQDPVPEDAGTCSDDSVRPRVDGVGVLLPQPRG